MIQDTIQATTTQEIQAQLFQARQMKLEELRSQKAIVEKIQAEVDRLESKIADNERLSDNS